MSRCPPTIPREQTELFVKSVTNSPVASDEFALLRSLAVCILERTDMFPAVT